MALNFVTFSEINWTVCATFVSSLCPQVRDCVGNGGQNELGIVYHKIPLFSKSDKTSEEQKQMQGKN